MTSESGFTLIEVMMAMIVLAFGIIGVMATFQWSDHAVRVGSIGALALSFAEARIEAKRAVPWAMLLQDDMNGDGIIDIVMRDDGAGEDQALGDGIYTAAIMRDGVQVIWTVESARPGPIQAAGLVTIGATTRYAIGKLPREVRLRTIRANPAYVGL